MTTRRGTSHSLHSVCYKKDSSVSYPQDNSIPQSTSYPSIPVSESPRVLSFNGFRSSDTQGVRKRQYNRWCELTRPAASQNGGNQPTRVPTPVRVGRRHVKAIAGIGEVAVGAEEATGEVPRESIQLRHHKTLPLPSSWLTLPLPPIPQKNPLQPLSRTPDPSLPGDILRQYRRIRHPFHLRRAPDLQTGEGDLNKEDHRYPHRTPRVNSLAFKL